MTNDADYILEALNTYSKEACSPNVSNVYTTAIVIKAPKVVYIKAKSNEVAIQQWPICGFYQVEPLKSQHYSPITIWVKDIDTGLQLSGEMDFTRTDQHPIAPLPDDIPKSTDDPSELEGLMIGRYFNARLLDFVALPEVPAIYNIYIQFGELVSNTVTVEVLYTSNLSR